MTRTAGRSSAYLTERTLSNHLCIRTTAGGWLIPIWKARSTSVLSLLRSHPCTTLLSPAHRSQGDSALTRSSLPPASSETLGRAVHGKSPPVTADQGRSLCKGAERFHQECRNEIILNRISNGVRMKGPFSWMLRINWRNIVVLNSVRK